ncbi:hypothetical protein EV659_106161 [Rhodothalassium salexigens DSM 2132]|uniref:Uncharacterized protein n=1 Tax=Rhodothalassium salexigens DSM 2132 TaxID=1188247 RepID=A0A4R2PIK9_RHOSA|nr:hypothetical protein [Rhodothalassium salexigens]MBB4211701.1 hypothetical protein [Rhodothalassium salexigens DSM 2132]TCP34001.1 hypothetical protein EV659_106161 [Rhodothalassium salexigens DSM 2132]
MIAGVVARLMGPQLGVLLVGVIVASAGAWVLHEVRAADRLRDELRAHQVRAAHTARAIAAADRRAAVQAAADRDRLSLIEEIAHGKADDDGVVAPVLRRALCGLHRDAPAACADDTPSPSDLPADPGPADRP